MPVALSDLDHGFAAEGKTVKFVDGRLARKAGAELLDDRVAAVDAHIKHPRQLEHLVTQCLAFFHRVGQHQRIQGIKIEGVHALELGDCQFEILGAFLDVGVAHHQQADDQKHRRQCKVDLETHRKSVPCGAL